MKVMVTGASGFVGSHLAKMLAEQGAEVRVLVRPTSRLDNLQGVNCQAVQGDLRDAASLQAAVRGCEHVYHCAADYRLWTPHPQELYDANVEGTKRLLLACREAGVARTVVTSSVAAVGVPHEGGPGCETTPVQLADMIGHYKRSKYLAEQVALEFAKDGDPVVVVNPSTPVGDGDIKPTATGKIITEFLKGRMPAYVQTGLNFVDVLDVCRGHILAAEKGRPGQRYILGGTDMTLKELFETLSEISGVPAPKVQLPLWFAYIVGAIDTFVSTSLLHKEPRAPLEGVKMARKMMFFSSEKARQELNYQPGSPIPALRRAVEWFAHHHYVPMPPKLKAEKND